MGGMSVPIDGFSLNPVIRYLPYQFTPMALDSLSILRRANRYRPRIHALPDDYNQPIQPYETQQFQVQVDDGSYLWGVQFNQFSQAWAVVAPTGILWQITEACNGLVMGSDFTSGQGWDSFGAGSTGAGGVVPVLLTQPRLFLAPGNINVQISNIGTAAQRCQLLLYFAVPCIEVQTE